MPASKPATQDETQIDRFKALARELGCDEDEAVFDAAVKKVAEAPHQPKHEPKKRKAKNELPDAKKLKKSKSSTRLSQNGADKQSNTGRQDHKV